METITKILSFDVDFTPPTNGRRLVSIAWEEYGFFVVAKVPNYSMLLCDRCTFEQERGKWTPRVFELQVKCIGNLKPLFN